MSEEPKTERQFWTFAVKAIHLQGSRMFAEGWFILCTFQREAKKDAIIDPGIGLQCHVSYITPEATPATLEVTSLLAPNLKLDDVSPKHIVKGLQKIFSLPYEEIPDAPLDVPEHRIPPSKREKTLAALRNKRTSGTIGGNPWQQ